MDVAAASRVGRPRSRNEDRFGWYAEGRILALADDMGKWPHGGIASSLAVRETEACVEASGLHAKAEDALDGFGAATWIRGIFSGAREALAAARVTLALSTAMGTALMMGVLTRSRVVIGHAGHSRCYIWRAGH